MRDWKNKQHCHEADLPSWKVTSIRYVEVKSLSCNQKFVACKDLLCHVKIAVRDLFLKSVAVLGMYSDVLSLNHKSDELAYAI